VSEQKACALIIQRNSKDIEEEDRASEGKGEYYAEEKWEAGGRGWTGEEQCLDYEIGSGSFKRERKRCDVCNGGRLPAKDKRFAPYFEDHRPGTSQAAALSLSLSLSLSPAPFVPAAVVFPSSVYAL